MTGMNAAIRAARRLHGDAVILLQGGSHSTALSLAILAMVKAGKVGFLRDLVRTKDEAGRGKLWEAYRSHVHKNPGWISLPDVYLRGQRSPDETAAAVRLFRTELPQWAEATKQTGLYTDCLTSISGTRYWSIPDVEITAKAAQCWVKRARYFVPQVDITARELELWLKHFQSVTNMKEEFDAFLVYVDAVVAEGVASEGDAKEVGLTLCTRQVKLT